MNRLFSSMAIILAVILGGCASSKVYNKAFSAAHALQGNTLSYEAAPGQIMGSLRATLIQQGFEITTLDNQNHLIKATRKFPDPTDDERAYVINLTASVLGNGGAGSLVMSSANQQSVYYRTKREWWKLLWIIPLFPVSTEYETVITHEGDITDPGFYADFSKSLDSNVSRRIGFTIAETKPVAIPVEPPVIPAPSATIQGGSVEVVAETATPVPADVTTREVANAPGASQPEPATTPSPAAASTEETVAPAEASVAKPAPEPVSSKKVRPKTSRAKK